MPIDDSAARLTAELHTILRSIPDAIYVGTADGIKLANDPALSMLGFKTLEDLNHGVAELADKIKTRYADSGKSIPAEDQGYSHALQGRRLTREVIVRHIETGEDRILRSAAAPVVVNGKVIAAVAVNTDITDAKRNEHALEKAVRDRDEMLAIVSHDLRNLLNVVTTALALFRLGRRTEEENQTIETAMSAARSMTELIEDLMEVSTLEARQFTMAAKPERAAELLLAACERFESVASKKFITIICGDARALRPVLADARRIHQVFGNLVGNAIKFSSPGSSIEIGAEPDGEHTRFWVRDFGCGIAAEALPHVFDRFWQARTADRGSVGLGLAIAKGIVEAHGGRIWVESEEGTGSTFYFTLHTVTPTA